jgi:hypothetical protein
LLADMMGKSIIEQGLGPCSFFFVGKRSSFLRWRMSFSENRCPLFRDMR